MTLSWVAEYSDGRVIAEKDKQVNYSQLDRSLLRTLKLVDDQGKVKGAVTSSNGEVLFYRIRSVRPLASAVILNRIYYLGWRKREGTNITMHVIALSPDGDAVECKHFTTDYWFPEEAI